MAVTLGFAVPDLCVEPELITVIDGAYIERSEGCPLPGCARSQSRGMLDRASGRGRLLLCAGRGPHSIKY